MLIQVVVLRNIVEANPGPTTDYVHHTVVEESPLTSYSAPFCPDVGDTIRTNGKEYTVVSREFLLDDSGVDSAIKLRCYLRNQA